MDEAKLAWADLVQTYSGGKVMFVSTPELGEDHCWEGVRNGVYCIWREDDEGRWEICQRQHLMVSRPVVTDPSDPTQIYEMTIQEVIKRVRQLTLGSFDAPMDVQRERYALAIEVCEDWLPIRRPAACAKLDVTNTCSLSITASRP
ncbi:MULTISPECIES: hypothetical protein [Duganella]|uniref:Uncharacterized protein n=2 Tax=Duganella TaxID=75654 RepID=A0A845GR82_9BURK|nr:MULTISPECIES: hypothetical protein [Duganella]MYM80781.1 hypothetical protein [Duganella lactea]MYM96115.1 hypothetical protein [Duganella vulcania]